MRRSAKILILNKKGIIEKISHERRAYESVGHLLDYTHNTRLLSNWNSRLKQWRLFPRRKEPILGYVPKNDEKRIHAFKG